jgi:site-specific DNA-methyltransferase (cytosine-N4-specific)
MSGGVAMKKSFSNYTESGEWDFRDANTKEYTHSFHIYPAMMIPQIARELIQRYGNSGDLLFDPYCGTGTSLVEAKLMGMNSIGTDINPTARMIALSKTTDYDIETLEEEIKSFLDGLEKKMEKVLDYSKFDEPNFVSWERLGDWFPKKTISEISLALQKIEKIKDQNIQLFLKVALSECLRLVSYQRNGEFKLYRIPQDKRHDYYEPLFPKFETRIERNLNGYKQYKDAQNHDSSTEIYDFNTVNESGEDYFESSVNLVVTSPPYGDSGTTVAYAQFSWLSNSWLGLDDKPPGALDRELMGGRKKEVIEFDFAPMDLAIREISSIDEKRAMEVMHFYHEYLLSIENISSRITSGGHVCFVVGNRTVKGTQLPTDQFTAWAFEKEGFEYLETYVREIPNKRMPSRNSPSNISGKTSSTMVHEFIVVCKKI